MASPWHHAISSARKWGGVPEDYLDVHNWFDASKELHPDFRHRALRHHSQGIFEAERVFGTTVTISTGKQVPTRWIGEQHVKEDLGFIPTLSDWLRSLHVESWMIRGSGASRDIQAIEEEEERLYGRSSPNLEAEEETLAQPSEGRTVLTIKVFDREDDEIQSSEPASSVADESRP